MNRTTNMTAKELGQYLNLGRTRIYELLQSGEIRAARTSTGARAKYIINRKDADRWLERNTTTCAF